MVLHFALGSKDGSISDADLQRHLVETLAKLGKRERVCLVPPDYTRFHSNAGILTQACYEHYGGAVKDIMPALGTHAPITDEQRVKMFGEVPKDLFRVHDWRNDVASIIVVVVIVDVVVCFNAQEYDGRVFFEKRLPLDEGCEPIVVVGKIPGKQ